MPTWSSLASYLGPSDSTSFEALTKDANGKLVAAGTNSNGQPSVLLARFIGGTLDPAFTAGSVVSTLTVTFAAATVTVRPSSGDIFVGGGDLTTDQGGWGQWSPTGAQQWWKYEGNGGGGAFTWAGSAPMPGDTVDRIYTVGSGGDMFEHSSYIDRVMPTGVLDTSFGMTGAVQTSDQGSPPAYWYILKAVTVQADGRVLVAGQKSGAVPVIGRFWP